jgi:hypothetical protein
MSKVDDLIAAARAELGSPYVYGAEGPDNFDCSGLMQYVFAQVGVKLPRTAAEQQSAVSKVSTPVPGDLVFWGDPADHVALYIGQGKIIAAPQPGEVVKVQDVYGSPTYGRISGLGAASTYLADTATGGLTTAVSNTLTNVSAGFRDGMIKLLFAGGGLALVGIGLAKTLAPRFKKGVGMAKEMSPL